MKKRILTIAFALCLILCTTANAVEQRASYIPTLTFNGTTANCSVVVASLGHGITVVLELWDEDGLVESWTKSGTNYVKIEETSAVISGETYTLYASGTINNVAFDREMVTRTCP